MGCSTTTPGSESHTVLSVPKTLFSGDALETAWTEALCCYYTHVRVIDSAATSAELMLFNGSTYSLMADSYTLLASKCMVDVCKTPEGLEFCQQQSECVYDVFAP